MGEEIPLATRLQVLESKLRSLRPGIGLTKLGVYDLRLDALRLLTEMQARDLEFPVVLIDERIVCSGEVDVDAVMKAAAERIPSNLTPPIH